MLSLRSLVVLGCASAWCAACASSPAPLEPLEAVRDVPVTFEASLAPTIGERTSGEPRRAEPIAKAPAAPAPVDGVALQVRFASVSAAVLEELLPIHHSGGAFGVVVSRERVETLAPRLHADREVELVGAPELSLVAGEPAHVEISSSYALVGRFVVRQSSDARLGDPEITLLHEGVRIEALAKRGAIGVELDLALRRTDIVRPIEERVVSLPGFGASVTLSTPIVYEQHLSASASLAPDEMLLLGGLVDADGHPVVACVTGRRVAAESASTTASSAAQGALASNASR